MGLPWTKFVMTRDFKHAKKSFLTYNFLAPSSHQLMNKLLRFRRSIGMGIPGKNGEQRCFPEIGKWKQSGKLFLLL